MLQYRDDEDPIGDDQTPAVIDPYRDDEDEPDDIDVALPTVVTPEPADVLDAAALAPEQRLERQNLSVSERATRLVITDAESFARAGELLTVLADLAKQVEEFWKEPTAKAHAAWKALTDRRASMLKPLEAAKQDLGARYAAFKREEDRKAEEQRRRDEQAAKEAEQARLNAEAAALEQQAEETPEEQRPAILAEAAQVRQEAATVPAPVLPIRPTVTTPKGISTRSNWTCQVDDKMALVRAVAEGKVSLEALEPNMVYLRARAKADKDTFRCPGVRVYDAATVAVRR